MKNPDLFPFLAGCSRTSNILPAAICCRESSYSRVRVGPARAILYFARSIRKAILIGTSPVFGCRSQARSVVPVRVTGSRNKKKGALCTGHTQLGRFGDSSYRLITRKILWVSERDAMLVRTGGL